MDNQDTMTQYIALALPTAIIIALLFAFVVSSAYPSSTGGVPSYRDNYPKTQEECIAYHENILSKSIMELSEEEIWELREYRKSGNCEYNQRRHK